MRISLDGQVTEEQPTTLTWSDPRRLGFDGQGAPVYGPYRSCSLGFERLTTTEYHQWFTASEDGDTHTVVLPHPQSGIMTEYTGVYIQSFAPRMNTRHDCEGLAQGVDIVISKIEVT